MPDNDAFEAEGLVRVSTATKYLSLSRSKLYAMMDAGELPYVKFGKARRIRRSDLCELVRQRAVPAQQD